MFTGLIENTGVVQNLESKQGGLKLTIEAPLMPASFDLGTSLAINGVCLTIVDSGDNKFLVEIVPETVSRTTFGNIQVGNEVNLERPLRLSDRIDGHLVQGHVDGVGRVIDRKQKGNSLWVELEIPKELSPLVIEKGSIALDGISLTIASLTGNLAAVSIIPHTASVTTLGSRKIGDEVNIEVDMIGRYVASLLTSEWKPKNNDVQETSSITEAWLKDNL